MDAQGVTDARATDPGVTGAPRNPPNLSEPRQDSSMAAAGLQAPRPRLQSRYVVPFIRWMRREVRVEVPRRLREGPFPWLEKVYWAVYWIVFEAVPLVVWKAGAGSYALGAALVETPPGTFARRWISKTWDTLSSDNEAEHLKCLGLLAGIAYCMVSPFSKYWLPQNAMGMARHVTVIADGYLRWAAVKGGRTPSWELSKSQAHMGRLALVFVVSFLLSGALLGKWTEPPLSLVTMFFWLSFGRIRAAQIEKRRRYEEALIKRAWLLLGDEPLRPTAQTDRERNGKDPGAAKAGNEELGVRGEKSGS